MAAYIRKRVLSGELVCGVGANLGSCLTVEMIGLAGFDWVWIDCEHGAGDHSELVHQLQAASAGNVPAVVRIAWNEPPRFKRALDLGPVGVMVPWVNTATEAEQAVRAMRYPPQGSRGVARFTRSSGFGQRFRDVYEEANQNLLTVVQIETGEAVRNAGEIAAVDGVDVLFVGPLDLSTNLGVIGQYTHPKLEEALEQVLAACRRHAKAPEILVPTPDLLGPWILKGFTFLVVATDGGLLGGALKNTLAACNQWKSKS